MAQYDGSIRINTKIDSKQASAQLMSLENRIVKTANKVESLRSKMDALKNVQIPTQEYQEIQKQIAETEKKLALLAERKEKFLSTGGKESSSAFKRMEYDAEQLNRTLEYSKAELQDLVDTGKAFTLGSGTQEYSNLGQQLLYAENDLSALNQKHDELISKGNKTKDSYMGLGESVKNAFRLMGKGIKDIPISIAKSGIKKLQSEFSKLGVIAKKVATGPFKILKNTAKSVFSRITQHSKKTGGFLSTLGSRFKGLALSLLVFNQISKAFNAMTSSIKEGYSNLYNDNERFKNSVDSLKASATTLKNSLAAAFRPLVDIAIPYIQKVMDYMSGLLDSVGQFLAAITGQKMYTKAIKQTTAALKEEKKAAEGYLSPLDEINKYQTNKDSGADTGTGGTMFEELPISDKFKDLAQWFKDMWANADFTQLGTLVGEKLKNALDNIPWDQIKETARKIGSSIATFINGFVEVDGLGYSIGKTLSEAVNTGFEFLNEFVHKLHWDSIGSFIADSLNGIFQNIDWLLIYDTFVTGAKGLGDAINSFVDDLDWNSIANSVSNLVNTFVDTVYTFITTIDWKELGEKVGKTISDAWNGVDWRKAGETLGEVFIAFFDFISKAIENVDWHAVGESVKEFLIGIDWAGVSAAVFEAIGAAFGGIGAFFAGLFGDGITNGAISEYFAEKIREAGGNIVEGIYNGIVEGLSNVGDWIYENILKPFLDGFKAAFGIHSPSTVMAELGKYLIEGLLNGINSLADTVRQAWQSMKETAVTIWNNTKEGLSTTWNNIKNNAKTVFDNVKTNISNAWNNARQNTRTAWENMKSNVITAAQNIASNVKSKYENIKSSIRSFASSAPSIWRGAWDTMKNAVSSVLGTIKNTVSSAFSWISSKVKSIGSSLKNLISKASSVGNSRASYSFARSAYSVPSPYTLYPAMAAVDTSKIPGYATGQVIPTTMKKHLAILGDNNRETEVVSPLSTIKQANKESLLEVLSELGLTGGRGAGNPQTIVIKQYLDGKQITQAVIKEGKIQQMSTGSNPFMLGTT